ncbi:MAG: S8 family serine peptidase [Patescibacteria group bacterium]
MPDTDSVVVTFSEPQKTEEFLNEFSEQIEKSNIEEDIVFSLTTSFNDPLYTQQTNLGQVGMPTGWNYMNDASSTKIAIVDTGVRGTHEDLYGNVLAGYDVLTSSAILANANSDNHGHGTAMASAAAAIGNNNKGGVGTAYNAKILPVKAFESDGTGLSSDIATGIRWGANNGANVINMSFGSNLYSQVIHDAIVYAKGKGCMLVASSGNEGTSLSYPGSDAEVLTVGSVNSSNSRSSFSNYGSELDVMAPGEGIIAASYSNDSSYILTSGTSVSAAQISGIAVYSILWHSNASVNERINYFKDSAKKVTGMGGLDKTDYYGFGIANYDYLQTRTGDYQYSVVDQSAYPTIQIDSSNRFTLSVKNIGKSTWRVNYVNLGTSRERDRIPAFLRECKDGSASGWIAANRIKLTSPIISPGDTGTYSFCMQVPNNMSPGTYREYFQLVADGVGWMTDYGIYWDVRVPQPLSAYDYSIVSQNGYPTLNQGGAGYNFVLTVKNTGSQTWQKNRVNLGTSRSHDRIPAFLREGGDPSGWISPNRIAFQESSVAPGQNATYSFWMQNSGVGAGTYREYFQLVADGVGWMTDYGIYWDVRVPQPLSAYDYSIVSQNGYPTLNQGGAGYNFVLTVKNTGSQTWQKNRVNLGTSRSHDRIPAFLREGGDPSGWISPNRIAFQESSVAPGQNATYSFWMQNSGVGAGTYREYFQLVADGIGWMTDYGIYWDVRVN